MKAIYLLIAVFPISSLATNNLPVDVSLSCTSSWTLLFGESGGREHKVNYSEEIDLSSPSSAGINKTQIVIHGRSSPCCSPTIARGRTSLVPDDYNPRYAKVIFESDKYSFELRNERLLQLLDGSVDEVIFTTENEVRGEIPLSGSIEGEVGGMIGYRRGKPYGLRYLDQCTGYVRKTQSGRPSN